MVFSSAPVYLDPHNWQQQPNHHQGSEGQNPQLPLLPQPDHHAGGDGGAGSIRPGSMSDRARLAKIPQPETALKCPRCESTNTKFCYFNNYNLSQPRHYCKTCRRYWTRGGALRNVPVGGGCRRNKKNKSSRHKSPAAAERQTGPNSGGAVPSAFTSEIIGHFPQQSDPQLPFMAPLQNLSRYAGGSVGLNFRDIQLQTDMGYQIGTSSGGSNTILSSGVVDQWRLQQFPFLGGFESPASLYSQLPSEGVEAPSDPLVGDNELRTMTSSSRVSQLPPVIKSEERHEGRNVSGLNWPGGIAWSDLSGVHSSTSHL